ncbi:MAG: MbnP family protein [Bacteroidota bacterium]
MRQFFYLFSIAVLSSVLFVACDDDDQGSANLDVIFKARYGDDPLVMLDQVYTYPDGTPIKFQLVNYYISDLALVAQQDNRETVLSEVELISYADFYDSNTADGGVRFSYDDLTPGTYDQIQFGMGLNAELNATQPSNYQAGHPLTDNFWSWARGYVFAKIEANADLDGDGEFSDKLTYHIGADDLFTVGTVNNEVAIQSGKTTELTFVLDLEQVLQRDGDFLDLNELSNTIDHTNNPDIYQFLWENIVNNIALVN